MICVMSYQTYNIFLFTSRSPQKPPASQSLQVPRKARLAIHIYQYFNYYFCINYNVLFCISLVFPLLFHAVFFFVLQSV